MGMKKGYKYNRILQRGAPLDRFERKYIPEPNSGCWLWLGSQCNPRYGYGSFSLNRRNETAHRASWMLLRGPIPAGMEIDHKCKNPYCVNPDHLRVATPAENAATRNLIKQMCRKGIHRLDGDNVQLFRSGTVRVCRACRSASRLRYQTRVRRTEVA